LLALLPGVAGAQQQQVGGGGGGGHHHHHHRRDRGGGNGCPPTCPPGTIQTTAPLPKGSVGVLHYRRAY
jgi:hypothetical protein